MRKVRQEERWPIGVGGEVEHGREASRGAASLPSPGQGAPPPRRGQRVLPPLPGPAQVKRQKLRPVLAASALTAHAPLCSQPKSYKSIQNS